jgi:hypothetical protein
MSAYYWKNRWVNALVHNGVERSVAEKAYADTYRAEPADFSKSPEIQALMMAGDKLAKSNAKSA